MQAETKAQETLLLNSLKAKFREEQPIKDIERQLEGLPIDDLKHTSRFTTAQPSPERKAVIPLLLCFYEKGMVDVYSERKFRAQAVAAVAALCGMKNLRQGPAARALRNGRSDSKDATIALSVMSPIGLELPKYLPLQCSFCLWDKTLQLDARTKSFARPDVLKKHLDQYHHQNPDSPRQCPECREPCAHKRHLRRHGQEQHGLILANL